MSRISHDPDFPYVCIADGLRRRQRRKHSGPSLPVVVQPADQSVLEGGTATFSAAGALELAQLVLLPLDFHAGRLPENESLRKVFRLDEEEVDPHVAAFSSLMSTFSSCAGYFFTTGYRCRLSTHHR